MKKLILFGIYLITQQMIFSQDFVESDIIDAYNNYKFNNPKEYSFVSTDRQIYFTGESIKLGVVIFDQYYLPTTLSKVCYLELIHESGDFSTKYALRLDGGVVNDQIMLPTNIPTGNYQLIAYTKFMQNYDLEKHVHRIPIYVQNTLESPESVVKSIQLSENELIDTYENQVDINVNGNDTKVFFEFISPSPKSTHFLVSEGLNGIQFVAKVDLKKERTSIGISREKFNDGFQKVILIDSEKNIASIKTFFLEASNMQDNENILVNAIAVYKEDPFNAKPQALIEQVHQLFFKLKGFLHAEGLTFEELTSDNLLDTYASYSHQEWSEILANKETKDFSFYPERNIQLRGKVTGPQELVNGASIIFHFFKNELDLSAPLNESGAFSIDLVFPVGQDYLSFSVIQNETLKDISDKVSVEVEESAKFQYVAGVDFHDKSLTDDYINSQLELKYALSTFYDLEKVQTFFWEGYTFDMTFKREDYVKLENFEEFIKEAVMNATIVEEKGKKFVNIYNGLKGSFERPQLILHNNQAIRDQSKLFELSFNEIDSVMIAFNAETIRSFGNSFNKGIIAVVSKADEHPEPEDQASNFIPFTGYHYYEEKNSMAEEFEITSLFKINNESKASDRPEADEPYHLQSIGTDGKITYSINKLKK